MTRQETSAQLSREQSWLADWDEQNLVAQVWALDPARFERTQRNTNSWPRPSQGAFRFTIRNTKTTEKGRKK